MHYLIAGASSDMGRELIKYIDSHEENAVVYAHYNRGFSKIEDLKKSLQHTEIIPIQSDLGEKSQALKILEEVNPAEIDAFLYLPAYPFSYTRLKEYSQDKLENEMQINVYSFIDICKELVPFMKKKENARILAMVTKYVADEMPPKFMTDYIVSKYALLGAVKSIASEHGGKGLKVNAISPDMVETGFLKNIDEKIIEMNRMAGGVLQPEDTAAVIYEMLQADYTENGYNRVVKVK